MKCFLGYYFAWWYAFIIFSKAILLESLIIERSTHPLSSYQGEIIVDVVKAKSLDNIVLIFEDKYKEEALQVTSSLQSDVINVTCTLILVGDVCNRVIDCIQARYSPFIENVAKFVTKQLEIFTYFVIHFNYFHILDVIREYDKVSKVIVMSNHYYLFPYIIPSLKARIFTNVYFFQPGSLKLPSPIHHFFGL